MKEPLTNRRALLASAASLLVIPRAARAQSAADSFLNAAGAPWPAPRLLKTTTRQPQELDFFPGIELGNSVEFSLDGRRLLTTQWDTPADRAVYLWEVQTSRRLSVVKPGAPIYSAHFSADGSRLVTGSMGGTARVWDVTTGDPVGEPLVHPRGVPSASLLASASVFQATFSPDGARVLTATLEGTARLWDARTGRRIGEAMVYREPAGQWPHVQLQSARFHPDGRQILLRWEAGSQLWDVQTGKPSSEWMVVDGGTFSAVLSPDGAQVLTASRGGSVALWSATTGQALTATMAHREREGGWLRSASFSSDGRRLLTIGNRIVRAWDAATGRLLGSPIEPGAFVVNAAFAADGARLFTASSDGLLRAWSTATGKPAAEPLRVGRSDGLLWTAAFYAGAKRVLAMAGGRDSSQGMSARLWNLETGQAVAPSLPHDEGGPNPFRFAFSADESRLATMGSQGTAHVWDADTAQPIGVPMKQSRSILSIFGI